MPARPLNYQSKYVFCFEYLRIDFMYIMPIIGQSMKYLVTSDSFSSDQEKLFPTLILTFHFTKALFSFSLKFSSLDSVWSITIM